MAGEPLHENVVIYAICALLFSGRPICVIPLGSSQTDGCGTYTVNSCILCTVAIRCAHIILGTPKLTQVSTDRLFLIKVSWISGAIGVTNIHGGAAAILSRFRF